jgi:hypothetical protein
MRPPDAPGWGYGGRKGIEEKPGSLLSASYGLRSSSIARRQHGVGLQGVLPSRGRACSCFPHASQLAFLGNSTKRKVTQAFDFIGAPGEIRTPDPQIRSLGASGRLGSVGLRTEPRRNLFGRSILNCEANDPGRVEDMLDSPLELLSVTGAAAIDPNPTDTAAVEEVEVEIVNRTDDAPMVEGAIQSDQDP